jgi:hypothetical protein
LFRLDYSSSDHDLLLFDLDSFLVLQPYLDQGGFFGNELWFLSLRGTGTLLPHSEPGVFWHECWQAHFVLKIVGDEETFAGGFIIVA